MDEKWDRAYQNALASWMLYDLGIEDANGVESMAFLAECMSTAEWREWLVNNFLDD